MRPVAPMLYQEVDHGSEEGLQFTGRLFGGLMGDIRRKLPWYRSDFTDALHIQVRREKYFTFHHLSLIAINYYAEK